MLVSTLIGAAGALGSAIYGGIKSAKANNQARRLIQQQRDENRRWYDTKMNQDYTQRADVQSAITKQRELLDEQLKRANARSVVGGASPEAAALEKEAANKSLADATAQIAAAGAEDKDRVEREYRAQDQALNQQQAQSYADQAAQTAAAAGQAVNAGLGMIGTGDTKLGDILSKNSSSASASPSQPAAAPRGTLGTSTSSAIPKPADILSQEQLEAQRNLNKKNN